MAASTCPPDRIDGSDGTEAARVGHTGRLVLTTTDPHVTPHADLLVESLVTAGFIGEPLTGQASRFLIGPSFLSLVTFAGCAVRIESRPTPNRPFCHVRISPSFPHPRLLHGRNTRAPRCHGCRARLVDWRAHLEHWATHPHAGVTCPACAETRPPWLWDWKQQGGFGRFFVQVEEVFPGEATPTHTLIELLTRASGTGWRHFYVQG